MKRLAGKDVPSDYSEQKPWSACFRLAAADTASGTSRLAIQRRRGGAPFSLDEKVVALLCRAVSRRSSLRWRGSAGPTKATRGGQAATGGATDNVRAEWPIQGRRKAIPDKLRLRHQSWTLSAEESLLALRQRRTYQELHPRQGSTAEDGLDMTLPRHNLLTVPTTARGTRFTPLTMLPSSGQTVVHTSDLIVVCGETAAEYYGARPRGHFPKTSIAPAPWPTAFNRIK